MQIYGLGKNFLMEWDKLIIFYFFYFSGNLPYRVRLKDVLCKACWKHYTQSFS